MQNAFKDQSFPRNDCSENLVEEGQILRELAMMLRHPS
jgi:hypothetical protein